MDNPYKANDYVIIKERWNNDKCPPVGATARVTSVHGSDTMTLVFDPPFHDRFPSHSLFGGLNRWFQLAEGPW